VSEFFCYDDQQAVLASTSNVLARNALAWGYVAAGECMYAVQSENVAYRCIFSGSATELAATVNAGKSSNGTSVTLAYNTAKNVGGWFTQYIGDIMTLRGYVFGFGLGVSVGISFLYLYFLRIPGLMFTVIWSVVLSIQVVLVIGTSVLNQLAISWEDAGVRTQTEILVIKIFVWIGVALNVLYFGLVLVLRKRIMLAIGIIKEAGKALASMPALMIVPVVQSTGIVIFLVPWFIYMLYLASSGSIQNVQVYNPYTQQETTFRQFGYDDNTKYAMLYLLFCWFWTSQFIIALGQLTLAMAVVCWYFTRDKSTVGNGTVLWVRAECNLS
jgi:hypothetical protein